jgi:hypothetical protein
MSTAHLFKVKNNNIIRSVKKKFYKSKVKNKPKNLIQINLNTVTSLMPDLEAPKQSPVDIAPQPAYKSNKLHSDLSAAATLDPDSLEIVEVLLSILTGSVSIVQTTANVKKKQ